MILEISTNTHKIYSLKITLFLNLNVSKNFPQNQMYTLHLFFVTEVDKSIKNSTPYTIYLFFPRHITTDHQEGGKKGQRFHIAFTLQTMFQ